MASMTRWNVRLAAGSTFDACSMMLLRVGRGVDVSILRLNERARLIVVNPVCIKSDPDSSSDESVTQWTD
jgi:hypothetical protein